MRKDDFMFECLNYINTSKLYHSGKRRKVRKQKRKKPSSPNVAAITAVTVALAVGSFVPIGISTGVLSDRDSDIRYEKGQDEIGSMDEFTLDGNLYNIREVYEETQYISHKISTISNEELELSFDIYEIQSIAPIFAVAVKRNNEPGYYIYSNTDYKPETLGQLMDDLSLKENLVFEDIYIRNGDEEELCDDYDEAEVFKLLFEENRDLTLTQKEMKNKRISIGTSIERLGNINVVILISDNGYIYINLLDYEMAYAINNIDELIEKIQNG